MDPKHDLLVDGQSINQICHILDVRRTMGPPVKNRKISVKLLVRHDIMKTIDVLNRTLTGQMQQFIFTDQPDRFWRGRVLSDIKPTSSWQNAEISFEIEVPSGVAYSLEYVNKSFKSAVAIEIENRGTNPVRPILDIQCTDKTYMVAVTSSAATMQYGESFDSAPLKKIEYVKEPESETVKIMPRNRVVLSDNCSDLSKWSNFDARRCNGSWSSAGNFYAGSGKAQQGPVNGKITIAKWATHWQTRERIADWVKGKTFDVRGAKTGNWSRSKKAYLLYNGWVPLGWLLEQDIEGGNESYDTTFFVNTGSGQGWHGPAIVRPFDGEPTNWACTLNAWFTKRTANAYGAIYVGVFTEENEEIAGLFLSAHQPNFNVNPYGQFRGEGCFQSGQGDKFNNFYGRLKMVKDGRRVTFSVYNERSQASFETSRERADIADMKASKVVIWHGQYGGTTRAQVMHVGNVEVAGTNALTAVKALVPEVKGFYNIPDPRYIFKAGDMITLDMRDNLTYLNNIPELNPLQRGSKSIEIPPGKHELIISTDGAPPDVTVQFREEFR